MNVSTRTIKAHLWAATAASSLAPSPTSLRAYLVTRASQGTTLLAAGQIKSNSANGHTTEFGGTFDAQQEIGIWTYLVELFDIATTELQHAATPVPTPTDTQVAAQMEADLRPCKGATGNYMWLFK